MLSPEFVENMKIRLLEQKIKLEGELNGVKPHTELGNNYDDTASELPLDEVNQDVIAQIKLDLEKIEHALEKIAAGTYGIDDEGNEISEERLDALPYADKAI